MSTYARAGTVDAGITDLRVDVNVRKGIDAREKGAVLRWSDTRLGKLLGPERTHLLAEYILREGFSAADECSVAQDGRKTYVHMEYMCYKRKIFAKKIK